MEAFLVRSNQTEQATLGQLIFPNGTLCTLERPWLNNQRNMSCIPEGSYKVTYMERSASGKYKQVYHVHGVQGRSAILMHSGNVVAHTRGCPLIGLKHGVLAGEPAVLSSKSGMRQLHKLTGKQDFILHVVAGGKNQWKC